MAVEVGKGAGVKDGVCAVVRGISVAVGWIVACGTQPDNKNALQIKKDMVFFIVTLVDLNVPLTNVPFEQRVPDFPGVLM